MPDVVPLEQLRDWMAKCDPWAPIGPEHPFFIDFYNFEYHGRTVSLRGEGDGAGPGLEQVALAIQTAKGDSSCSLFSGYSGTGKSSELLGFKRGLERSGYLVLIADAQAYLNLKRPLTITELLIVVAAAFGDVAAKRLAEDSGKNLGDDLGVPSYLSRFFDFLKQDVELGGIKLPTGVGDLQVGISTNQPFWVRVRDRLAASVGRLQQDAHDYVKTVIKALRRAYSVNGIVFVLDSLEKIRGTQPDEFDAVIDSVIEVFDKQASLVRFPCHIVYTIPPYIRQLNLGTYYDHRTEILPSIRVHERGSTEPYAPGVEALCELVRRRLPVARVFGPDEALLRRLVHYSGGHVRLLLTFVRDVLLRVAQHGVPVDPVTIERVLQRHREDAETALWDERLQLLRDIIVHGELPGMKRAQLPILAGLLDEYTVLCYRNGSGWYDVHPLVRDKVLELVARQAAADTP